MKDQTAVLDSLSSGKRRIDVHEWRRRGAAAAPSFRQSKSKGRRFMRRAKLTGRMSEFIRRVAADPRQPYAEWILDNIRLIRSAEKESREFFADLREFPQAADASGAERPRACVVAREYIQAAGNRFHEETFAAFLQGYQETVVLSLREIWGLKPALMLELSERLYRSESGDWPDLIGSLRRISETTWKDVFEAANIVDRVLEEDPAGAYAAMDYESREYYRTKITKLAKRSSHSERDVAESAVELAGQYAAISDGSRSAVRRTHVGFFLLDDGLPALEAAIHYKPSIAVRVQRFILRNPTVYYLAGIELVTLLVVCGMLAGLDSLVPIFAGLLLLLIPATQAAVDFMNNLTTSILPPRVLPKLDFSQGIPEDCTTMVAVPTLLLNEAQVHDLVLDLEIRFLANRDPNLYFALLTDTPDADQPNDHRDSLVEVCRQLIEKLNRRYGSGDRKPFFLFHRHRVYNESEGRWMGWERKRGKLLDLNRLLRGGFDAFPVKAGDLSVFPRIRYVITLDSDTQLPRDSAARLVGTIAHPLNRAVVDPEGRVVVEGYGILQPRIGISIQSASRSRLASLYSGQTGFDIYTHAISDVYQDLFGDGIFTGKGIYEVDTLREVLEQRFPENALLSHDLIEGAYARAALVSDIELIDDYPSHFSAYNRRKHRWVRGDWQILNWVRADVPDRQHRLIPNPITLISRWKIIDNLRRSLLEPSLLVLFLASWLFLPGPPVYWTAAAVAALFIPSFCGLLFALLRVPKTLRSVPTWASELIGTFAKSNAMALSSLIFLLHQALVSIDAIVRSVARVFLTRRKLLEWETAAEAEASSGPKATVDVYLEWTPLLAVAIGAAVWALHRAALPVAAPFLVLWLLSRAISSWLNRAPRTTNCALRTDEVQFLRDSAERTYRFFHDWSSPISNWLVPDSVREDGAAELRLSPTNLGMLLNARIAGLHLNLTGLAEFVFETRQTLDRVVALPKYRGHLFNWYDIPSLAPLQPRFVSTVDSGNLAASLWTLKQAALAFAVEPPVKRGVTKALAEELRSIADTADRLVREMDFHFLYNSRKKVLSVGYDMETGKPEPSCYDLLASEARMASFVAIAKGDIPQESWFRLGRSHMLFRGERVLLSWTGTMFEYLMPGIWMRMYPGTILEQSMKSVVRAQRDYARRKGVPWGISESACIGAEDGQYGYAPFGIPELSMKRAEAEALVIAPYATFLAATIDPQNGIKNLRAMEEFGWTGRYGFYEAVDYRRGGAQPIRSWMAHHQGMSLLAIVNLLFNNPLQNYFHAEPQVLATELLLHERVPAMAMVESETMAIVPVSAEA